MGTTSRSSVCTSESIVRTASAAEWCVLPVSLCTHTHTHTFSLATHSSHRLILSLTGLLYKAAGEEGLRCSGDVCHRSDTLLRQERVLELRSGDSFRVPRFKLGSEGVREDRHDLSHLGDAVKKCCVCGM